MFAKGGEAWLCERLSIRKVGVNCDTWSDNQ